jgi:hypothetical protein
METTTMPSNKDLKRLVRARMRKTGESYTTARAQIRRKPVAEPAPRLTSGTQVASVTSVDLSALAGMADTAIVAKTGRNWKEWVEALDWHGAEKMRHRDIAELVSGEFNVADWWAQTVTVGYERIKGLRARGQRRDGSYEASKSRTFGVPVSKLFAAWANPAQRRRWLNEPTVKVRTATTAKSMRFGWSDGSVVVIGFLKKEKGKSSVAVQHTKLSDHDSANRFKEYWSGKLDALGEFLKR